jgi:archaemetzincin
MPRNTLQIFYEDEEVYEPIRRSLNRVYKLDTIKSGILRPIKSAYNVKRGQYDTTYLLNYLTRNKGRDIALWVVDEDIYCERMNFVFGLASFRRGAILSRFRLNSIELIEREAVHEIEHVFGLNHCPNRCVMHFSNSLLEAIEKPSELCESCKLRIKDLRDNVPML